MSMPTADSLFAGGGGASGVPSFKFAQYNDAITGTILSTAVQQSVKFGTTQPDFYEDGRPKLQLQVIIQTELRNWEKVSVVPTNEGGQMKPAHEDDGRRAVYLKGAMMYAVGDAVTAATGERSAPAVGGKLHIVYTHESPSNKGNPRKEYSANYQPPTPGSEMFQPQQPQPQPQQQPQQPQPQPQQPTPWGGQQPTPMTTQNQAPAPQAPPQASSWGGQQPAPQAPPQSDPRGGQQQPYAEPPF